jgi:hypothetical protein
MSDQRPSVAILDPQNLDDSLRQVAQIFDLAPDMQSTLRRVVALYPRPVQMVLDEASALLYENLPLADKFTFDMETDELVLFSRQPDTLADALIEMAMYLVGFATLMGNREEWVVEFAIGAWKPVKNRIKRQLGISVNDQPRAVVGLPPAPADASSGDSYPFRTLVSNYDFASFHQMVVLAARDDVAVYFPPETHSKVLAVYVYMRRAIQEVAQGLGIKDHQAFNARLVEAVHRLEGLFSPSRLTPPDWQPTQDRGQPESPFDNTSNRLGMFPSRFGSERSEQPDHSSTRDSAPNNPFESFIEQLFPDDDADDGSR